MKYVINDADGKPIQWVNDETITKLPEGAVALTDGNWNDRQLVQSESQRIASQTFKAEQDAEALANAAAKAALLARLGITADEAKLLLG